MEPSEADLSAALDRLLAEPVAACVECGSPITMTHRARLYCSDACRQTLKAVHYGRGAVADGRIDDPLVWDAIGMRIAQILSGGYNEKARRNSPGLRREIFERDGGRCVLCGADATEIDHIRGDDTSLENMRAVCGPCNMGLAREHFVPATGEQLAQAQRIRDRVFAPTPLFERDDSGAWDTFARALMAQRRAMVKDHVNARRALDCMAAGRLQVPED